MFLAWNYTLELFFWIVLGAIILISLTILLAGPRFRSKTSETSEETLLLTGESVDSPIENIPDQDAASGRVEEELEILEEIEKGEIEQDNLPFSVRIRAYAIVLAYVLYSFFVSIIGVSISMVINPYFYIVSKGPLDRASSEEARSIVADNLFELSLGIAIFFSGLFSLYGFVIDNKKWFRDSCRMTAVLFLPVAIFNIDPVQDNFIGFVIIPLLFSGDLKRIWKGVSSNEEEGVTRFGKWVGNILKLLRKKWMAINTYTGIRYLLYLLAFLSVILFLAVFIFQFF